MQIYMDGARVDNTDASSGSFSGPYSGSNLPLALGTQFSDGWGMAGQFYGSEKQVSMYNRALSAAEISALYSGGITVGTATTTTLSSSQNPALSGTPVTFTATVSGSGGIPAGSVAFFDGSTNLGAGTLNGSDIATFSTTTLSAGSSPHLITAAYSGNSAFAGSTSSVLSQIITNAASTNTTTNANTLTNGLVAYYPLALNGNDVWAGDNLTLVGSPTFSSNAINWNGAISTVGYSLPQQWPQTGLTVAGWINMANPSANYIVACCYGVPNGQVAAAYMQFFAYGNELYARVVQNIDQNYIGRSTPAILTSGWHFAAFTWSGGTSSSSMQIYMDGVRVDNADTSSGTFSGPYSGSNLPLALGTQFSDGWGMAGQFYGSEKQVSMYNRALSAAEISALYSGGISGIAN